MTHTEHRAAVKAAWMDMMNAKSEVQKVKGKVDVQVDAAVKKCESAATKFADLLAVDTTKLTDR